MDQLLDQCTSSPATLALAHVVFALGSHIMGSEERTDMPKGSSHDPLRHFDIALKIRSQMMYGSWSLRYFQVSLTLRTLICIKTNAF
jgi:hypothetical protein